MIFAEVTLFPESASTMADKVDAVFFFIGAVAVVMSLLIAALLIYFAIRYRRRSEDFVPEPIVGSTRLEVAWIALPLIVALVMFVWSASAYFKAVRPPDDTTDVYVVGRQWMWKIQHPGGPREVNELHVPVGRAVRLIMTSEDVIHSFYVPEFRMKQDVLPGRYTYAWFEATRPGEYRLLCTEYCGTGHAQMIGKVIVMEPEEYQRWFSERADDSFAKQGRKLFMDFQCAGCHSAEPDARGPLLEGLFRRRVPLDGGGAIEADENYIRTSILKPREHIVAGFQPIMPTYEGQLDEEQILRLVAFIKSLGPGDTPPRIADDQLPEVKNEKK